MDTEKGVLLLDKPAGITSHDAVQKVRKILSAGRAGHTGTLDSGVTGLLVIALGEARKAIPVMMGLDKEYEGIMDIHVDMGLAEVRKAAKAFVGKMMQMPPKRSRVVRKLRERRVESFTITKNDGRLFAFSVKCEAGTYIRKLVHDLGKKLGCGAHMAGLRRTAVGPFSIREAVSLDRLKESDVMPLEKALDRVGLKKVDVTAEEAKKIRNGVCIEKAGAKECGQTGIYLKGRLIAIGSVKDALLKPERVFNK